MAVKSSNVEESTVLIQLTHLRKRHQKATHQKESVDCEQSVCDGLIMPH